MAKRTQTYKETKFYPSRRMWVAEEGCWRVKKPLQEESGYNDWNIYQGA